MSLSIENISKAFMSGPNIREVSLSVNRGEIVGLLGPVRSGKSKVLDLISGINKLDSGCVHIDNTELSKLSFEKRVSAGIAKIGYDPSLFGELSVFDNVKSIAEIQRVNESLVEQLLFEYDLLNIKTTRCVDLSPWEKSRIEIVRMLIREPDFILIDEPCFEFYNEELSVGSTAILDLASRNIGLLIADSRIKLSLEQVDRAYLIFEGRILKSGRQDELENKSF